MASGYRIHYERLIENEYGRMLVSANWPSPHDSAWPLASLDAALGTAQLLADGDEGSCVDVYVLEWDTGRLVDPPGVLNPLQYRAEALSPTVI